LNRKLQKCIGRVMAWVNSHPHSDYIFNTVLKATLKYSVLLKF
jgi:hypothetical protein